MTLNPQPFLPTKYVVAAYVLFFIVTLAGMFIPLMDNDAGEYAIIAMRMAQTNDYINIVRKSEDYLDKPHLLFWLSALSMKIFGFTSFAYKLPSVLFAFAAVYATTRLGQLLYNKETGILAGLVLAFSQAFILSNHDVRTDAMLTGATIFSIYKLIAYSKCKQYIDLVLGALFVALAVGTKGMVAALVTGTTVLAYLLYNRKAKELLSVAWVSSIAWFFLFLSPFLYCYYLQFDAHPEKIVKGVQHVSGIRFLLWGQSFERLSGQNNMVDNPDYFFFFHTLLWAFLPWSIITYFGIYKHLATLFKNRLRMQPGLEASMSVATVLLLLVFSASKFKLPHYLNILFPLMSIVTAETMLQAIRNARFAWIQKVLFAICIVYVLGVTALNSWAFPLNTVFLFIVAALCIAGIVYAWYVAGYRKPIVVTLVVVGCSNLMLNLNFFNRVLQYQGGNTLATYVNDHSIDKSKLTYYLTDRAFSFDYYSRYDVPEKTLAGLKQLAVTGKPFYIITNNWLAPDIAKAGIVYHTVKTVSDYHVSVLSLPFLNPARRAKELDQLLLLQVK